MNGAAPARPSLLFIVLGLVVLLLLAMAAAVVPRLVDDPTDTPAVVGATELRVVDSDFEPPVVEVDTGSELTWTWAGSQRHNVVFGADDSSPTRADGTWSRTFDQAGTYDYRCTLHMGMRGRVEVVDP